MIRSRGCGALLGIGLLSGAEAVRAAPTAGRVRLSLEGELFGYEKVSVESVSSSQTSGGLAPSLGVGIGGGIGNNVLLGARVGVATSNNSVEGSSTSTSITQFTMLAIPEYVFDGDAVRPFLGAGLGYSVVNTDTGAGKVSSGLGLFGASFGAHCFAADSFSIDPSVSTFYEVGSASAGDTSRSASGFAVILGVALSGWFGHVAKPAESEDESAGFQATAAAPPAAVPPAARAANWEDEDELRAVVKLTGASRLSFRIEPSESDAVELVVIVDHDNPQLASCNELVARTAKQDVRFGPFTVSKVGGAFQSMVALTTKTTIANSKALVAKDVNVKLEGCGESWEITEGQTEELRTFVKHARAAVRQNQPPAAGAAPAAEPAPEPPPSDEGQ